MKKLLKGMIVGAAILGLAGTASAATYKVNMCGASAQAGFWEQAGAAVVQSTFNCLGGAVLDGIDDKHMIVRGLQCTADATGNNDDTVYVRYNAVNSQFGCENYNGVISSGWAAADSDVDATTLLPVTGDCDWTNDVLDCSVSLDAACMLGCADVPCNTITATTIGYEDGRAGAPSQGGGDPMIQHGNPLGFSTASATEYFFGVTVPFGFIVNNAVKDWVCVSPDQDDELPENAHLAYCKENWECDPRLNMNLDGTLTAYSENYNPQCAGDYKCIDAWEEATATYPKSDGIGVCLDGTQDTVNLDKFIPKTTPRGTQTQWGKACVNASDCKMPLSMTKCGPRTLKNVSRLMALLIFSDAVDNWQDFGPSFENLAIVKCMRHGGSGTHQTLIDFVFRGDAIIQTFTNEFPMPQGAAGASYVWHYKSSSDLTRDCVAYYAGGIGYVDADKIMFRSKIAPTVEPANWAGSLGISQLMLEGVAPSRLAVAQGKYPFWAQQQCFLNGNNLSAEELYIYQQVMAGAANPAQLTFARFGQRAFFWATQGEMRVEKTTVYTYPTRVTPDPGLPPVDPGPYPLF